MQPKKLVLILLLIASNCVMYPIMDFNYLSKNIPEVNFSIKDTIIPVKKAIIYTQLPGNSNINTSGHFKKSHKTTNVTTYSELKGTQTHVGKYKKPLKTTNVTTYSKLKGTQTHVGKYKKPLKTTNVTTYSKLTNSKTTSIVIKKSNRPSKAIKPTIVTKKTKYTSNVSSYTKKNSNPKKITTPNSIKKSVYTTNVTSYSKIPKSWDKKKSKVSVINSTKQNSINPVTLNVIHNDPFLDTAINVKNIDKTPIYPGCENRKTEIDKKNCFFTKISTFTNAAFNVSHIKKGDLKKGYKQIRVLFITDKNGKIITRKIIGKWPSSILRETHRVMNLLPIVKPGYSNGNPINVKFSFTIPFIM